MKQQLVMGAFLALLLASATLLPSGAALLFFQRPPAYSHDPWQEACGGFPMHSCNPVSTWIMVDGVKVYLCPTPAPNDTCYKDD